MPQYVIELSRPVPEPKIPELAKRIYFASPEIVDFSLVQEADRVTGLIVTADGDADPAELRRKLDIVVSRDVLPQRVHSMPAVWTSPHARHMEEQVFAELEACGAIVEMGEGMYAVGQSFLTTMNALDRKLQDLATDAFRAVVYRYPTLLRTEVVRRAGYLDTFPQFLMSASRIHADVDTYAEFTATLASADDVDAHLDRFSEHFGYCLPPTMCFHTYQHLRDGRLPADGAVVTARGKSFRFESRYWHSLERLWDFTIREIVFLGEEEAVVAQRRRFMDAAFRLMTELRLAGHTEVANDPFIGSDHTAELALAQRIMGLKYELRLPVEGGRTVAAGSFNLHGTKFGAAFGIALPDGRPAHSACVGFGLERLTYAFYCQHGTDRDRWPSDVHETLGTGPDS
ncbi:hypothetical protein [Streptomyces sp. VNUA24]|uniref:hypothetical protein n=1 Tax=Streptomyces sp. VNUA24 TaxID=3031131 RepID=UPI0023B798F5|nr:hypothetical protein [Streptomyces sp. VNUA24]WEH12247.1 hypothetical protein PYR72_00405 [Streptomyces sp. VNUA24]